MSIIKKNEKVNKIQLISGIIGTIAIIISIIMIITNPAVSDYQEFFKRSWFLIFVLVIFILPTITSNVSTFRKNSKNKK